MHITILNSAWFVVAVVGLASSASLMARYTSALRSAYRVECAARVEAISLMRQYFAAEGMRFVVHSASVAVCIWSFFIPPDRMARLEHVVYSRTLIGLLILCNLAITFNSLYAWYAWNGRLDRAAAAIAKERSIAAREQKPYR